MFINPINNINFESSRVKIARKLPKNTKECLKSMPELGIMAKKRDVYLKFSPVEKPSVVPSVRLQIFKRGIDHIVDIPDYVMTHNTGDAVYVGWEKELLNKELYFSKEYISKKLKQFLGYAD